MPITDEGGEVRAGEELDASRVAAFLRGVDGSLPAGLPEIRQFSGGASNLTYLLRFPDRELILRRPPFGRKARGAHDMKRESSIMRALHPVYPYVPRVIAYGEAGDAMDSDFYVMERVRGIILRRDLPAEIRLDPARRRDLCTSVIDRLIELHAVDHEAAGLGWIGKGAGYVHRQIAGWSERFRGARTPDVCDFERVMAWLAREAPAADVATCVIHNDFRFDNLVLDPDNPFRVAGVLDWEMATLGDPLMDLGNSLAYWVEAADDEVMLGVRRQPTHLPGMLTRRDVVDYYAARTGRRVEDFRFYRVYGLFRLAVIVQQIYYRFFHRQTTNPAFAGFGKLANHLESLCLAEAEAGAT